MAKVKYIVKGTDLRHNGKLYPENKEASFEEKEVERLAAEGILIPVKEAKSGENESKETGDKAAGKGKEKSK